MNGVIPTTMFYWNGKTRTFYANDAELRQYRYGSVVRVKNPTTGRGATFDRCETNRDAEGEVVSWTYISDDHGGMTLVIYND